MMRALAARGCVASAGLRSCRSAGYSCRGQVSSAIRPAKQSCSHGLRRPQIQGHRQWAAAGGRSLEDNACHLLEGRPSRKWSESGLSAAAAQAGSGPLVLGIESSCDDTGAAVVNGRGEILGEALATQAEIHAPHGGVVPMLAKEAHERAIDDVVGKALQRAGIDASQLDAVAVTIGPGLSLCLRVGVMKARRVAHEHRLPVVPVHHMEAHALVARCCSKQGVEFPFLCLLVSGGHNLLLVVRGVGNYLQLGSTLDDALGEAYDKVARLLGLDPKPSGGAALEAFAREGNPAAFPFTVPLRKRQNCDFSYAGLKTSVRVAIEQEVGEPSDGNRQTRADIAASFQATAVRHLAERVARGADWAKASYPEIETLVVAGGVACNQHVRDELRRVSDEAGLELVCPPPRLCTDNGVMVAWAGLERFRMGEYQPPPATAEPAGDEWVDLRPRWPLTDEKDGRCAPTLKSSRKKNIYQALYALDATDDP